MAKKTQRVGWGKPTILIKDIEAEGAGWQKCPTPVESSTQLTPTKGDKKEAKIEGGDNEDVLYGASNYALAYQIRRTSNKKMPIRHEDGVVAHHYAVIVIPQNAESPGCYIADSAVSVEDAFSTTDGGTDLYTHDAVLPEGEKRKVKWGVFALTDDGGTISVTATGEDFGEAPVTL